MGSCGYSEPMESRHMTCQRRMIFLHLNICVIEKEWDTAELELLSSISLMVSDRLLLGCDSSLRYCRHKPIRRQELRAFRTSPDLHLG